MAYGTSTTRTMSSMGGSPRRMMPCAVLVRMLCRQSSSARCRRLAYCQPTLKFEARQEENLLELQLALESRSYSPSRSVCFCQETQTARGVRCRFPRPRGAPCAGGCPRENMGAGVHPRFLCLPQGQGRAAMGRPAPTTGAVLGDQLDALKAPGSFPEGPRRSPTPRWLRPVQPSGAVRGTYSFSFTRLASTT